MSQKVVVISDIELESIVSRAVKSGVESARLLLLASAAEYLDEDEVSRRYMIRKNTLRGWRKLGFGPAYSEVETIGVRYKVSDLEEFFNNGRVEPLN